MSLMSPLTWPMSQPDRLRVHHFTDKILILHQTKNKCHWKHYTVGMYYFKLWEIWVSKRNADMLWTEWGKSTPLTDAVKCPFCPHIRTNEFHSRLHVLSPLTGTHTLFQYKYYLCLDCVRCGLVSFSEWYQLWARCITSNNIKTKL